ncbi:ATP-binding protein [Mucilaginibacter aquariorum]|uniref:ATP-binding protein n=1 Tax=Mucilaginibacter aquariorum TaxID=2967225 RepID=A0ABT1SYW2_9SPHI|nr:ATP-binding protein [Mucilaginibacter aquariorum]MCQ6957527.1 ATP-binding protein [Mucilaginibacter aquariorum]
MSTQIYADWIEANQRYLAALLSEIKAEMKLHMQQQESDSLYNEWVAAKKFTVDISASLPNPAVIDELCRVLNLSVFERKIILLCAGVELDEELSQMVFAYTQTSVLPTFRLALHTLTDAHWSALSPVSPLRYWRLIELTSGELMAGSPLKIDEQVLHYLTGVNYMDERLTELLEAVDNDDELVPSQQALADQVTKAWSQTNNLVRLIQLVGADNSDKRAIAKTAAAKAGYQLYAINAGYLPSGKSLSEFIRLWNRESALNNFALFIDCLESDLTDKTTLQSVTNIAENTNGLTFISTTSTSLDLKRQQVVLNVNKPTIKEQLMLWQMYLKPELKYTGQDLSRLVSQFNMSTKTIRMTALEANHQSQNGNATKSGKSIWSMCCAETRPQLNELAERVIPVAKWDDLVIPQQQKEILKEIAIHVQHRITVYDDWGFAAKSARGLGISVLFYGESGTGKTMASEVLANELQLDLYRIDLSQVVNKYIGETEKNLKKIFDAAEDGGSILLFDEADALFGRRSEVKDSHDRYGNIEVSYLLQRMESYRGLAILTTNMKGALDNAFLRRLRFVVQFPFPDTAQRSEIWKRAFPKQTPTQDLDMEKLARLNVAGGNIKNIAMNASFIAANDGQPVQMAHISRAARSEYTKLEKMLSSSEINYW